MKNSISPQNCGWTEVIERSKEDFAIGLRDFFIEQLFECEAKAVYDIIFLVTSQKLYFCFPPFSRCLTDEQVEKN